MLNTIKRTQTTVILSLWKSSNAPEEPVAIKLGINILRKISECRILAREVIKNKLPEII